MRAAQPKRPVVVEWDKPEQRDRRALPGDAGRPSTGRAPSMIHSCADCGTVAAPRAPRRAPAVEPQVADNLRSYQRNVLSTTTLHVRDTTQCANARHGAGGRGEGVRDAVTLFHLLKPSSQLNSVRTTEALLEQVAAGKVRGMACRFCGRAFTLFHLPKTAFTT